MIIAGRNPLVSGSSNVTVSLFIPNNTLLLGYNNYITFGSLKKLLQFPVNQRKNHDKSIKQMNWREWDSHIKLSISVIEST